MKTRKLIKQANLEWLFDQEREQMWNLVTNMPFKDFKKTYVTKGEGSR